MSRADRPALVRVAATGLAMGAADVVPGFSGGTVAFVAGIYEHLVGQVRDGASALVQLVRLRPRAALRALRTLDWGFLAVLATGIAASILTLAAGVERLLADEPVLVSAAFLGLVSGATFIAGRQFRRPVPLHGVIVTIMGAVTFVALGVTPGEVVDPGPVALAGAGAVAVTAMILPGISGSFLLLLLGMYPLVIGAVAARDLAVLVPFGLGAVLGLGTFSTLLDELLERAHDVVLAVLLGLMVGSVRVLWPWPVGSGVGDPALGPPEAGWVMALAVAVAAASAVVAFARLATGRAG